MSRLFVYTVPFVTMPISVVCDDHIMVSFQSSRMKDQYTLCGHTGALGAVGRWAGRKTGGQEHVTCYLMLSYHEHAIDLRMLSTAKTSKDHIYTLMSSMYRIILHLVVLRTWCIVYADNTEKQYDSTAPCVVFTLALRTPCEFQGPGIYVAGVDTLCSACSRDPAVARYPVIMRGPSLVRSKSLFTTLS